VDLHPVDEDPDPTYHFDAYPDPVFDLCGSGSCFLFDADADSIRIQLFTLMQIRGFCFFVRIQIQLKW